jgi:hypothetical protein
MLGQAIPDTTERYNLPQLQEGSLDSIGNVGKYTAAKMVLEHPDVNAALKAMDAFDALNSYSVDSCYQMAQWVVEALNVYHTENDGTPQDSIIVESFPFTPESEELNDFGEEFIVEFTKQRFDATAGSEDGGELDLPQQGAGWLQQLASKFGFKDLNFKDLMYLYIINQVKGGQDAEMGGKSLMPAMAEEFIPMMNEKAPPGMEGWIKSVKSKFQKEYGDDWEKVLYATAWDRYNEGKKESKLDEADDASLKAEKTTVKVSKPSAKVKADVKQRMKELDDLIDEYKEKEHFHGTVKPAIFNARKALNVIMDHLNSGTLEDLKQAQIFLPTLMSPITNLFPPSLIKFLAYGSDADDAGGKPKK